ncbi:MAG: DUF4920 domain-containing protein [Deltaproteobacteria bacterium]|nr:DUF4920 domain-containing protein [Deltaproteobacteria bacterium]
MARTWFVIGVLGVGLGAAACQKSGASAEAPAAKEIIYGKGVGYGPSVSMAELTKNADAYVGKTVKVEGLVTDVCPRRGCWIKLGDDGQTLRFKVQDGVISFPLDTKGKRAVVEGVFSKSELTAEQAAAYAKHIAEEKGETYDPATAPGGQVVYQVNGEGAVVR